MFFRTGHALICQYFFLVVTTEHSILLECLNQDLYVTCMGETSHTHIILIKNKGRDHLWNTSEYNTLLNSRRSWV